MLNRVPKGAQPTIFVIAEEFDEVAAWLPTAYQADGRMPMKLPFGMQVYSRATSRDNDEALLELCTAKYQATLEKGLVSSVPTAAGTSATWRGGSAKLGWRLGWVNNSPAEMVSRFRRTAQKSELYPS